MSEGLDQGSFFEAQARAVSSRRKPGQFLRGARVPARAGGRLLGPVFIFWKTVSLIKGSYFDQSHCGGPIHVNVKTLQRTRTTQIMLKRLFFAECEDRPC